MRPQRFTNFAAGAATTKCSILYRRAFFVDFREIEMLASDSEISGSAASEVHVL
jgi:hypothetical protein